MKPDFSGPADASTRAALDDQCRSFEPLIEAAGSSSLTSAEWQNPAGLYAQMLLTDQFPRNAFRGSERAFAYDSRAMQLANSLIQTKAYEDWDAVSYYTFLSTPAQHSEELADHQLIQTALAHMVAKIGVNTSTSMILSHANDHREVVERFGRYPHRNEVLGRTSTDEELAWLADTEKLPRWAKSQMKK